MNTIGQCVRKSTVISALLLVWHCAGPIQPLTEGENQGGTSTTVHGCLFDMRDKAVVRQTVQLRIMQDDSLTVRSCKAAETDSDGRYVFSALEPATYLVYSQKDTMSADTLIQIGGEGHSVTMDTLRMGKSLLRPVVVTMNIPDTLLCQLTVQTVWKCGVSSYDYFYNAHELEDGEFNRITVPFESGAHERIVINAIVYDSVASFKWDCNIIDTAFGTVSGETVDTIRRSVFGEKTEETDGLFSLDSTAVLSIMRKSGNESFTLPKEWIDYTRWRIQTLEVTAVNTVAIGDIADELSRLAFLRTVTLRGFTGDTIPEQFGAMRYLEYLDIQDGSFSFIPIHNSKSLHAAFPVLRKCYFQYQQFSKVPEVFLEMSRSAHGSKCIILLEGNPAAADAELTWESRLQKARNKHVLIALSGEELTELMSASAR